MNIIIPIGGKGERFLNQGYKESKPLINVFGKPILHYVLDNLQFSKQDKIFIIYYNLEDSIFKNILIKKYPFIHFIRINYQTKGATETIFEGLKQIKYLTNYKKTMIFDCDTFYTEDVIDKYRNIEENAVFYVKNEEDKPIYSYIQIDDKQNTITNIAEKVKISNNANTGIYCFNDIDNLFNYSKFVVENNIVFNNECYTSCIIDQMIKDKNIFIGIELNSKYVFNLGTPEQLNAYINKTYIFLFDLDGTIVLTEDIYFDVWKTILNDYNYVLTPDIFKNVISGNTDETVIQKLNLKNACSLFDISNKKDELFIQNLYRIKVIEGVESILKQIKQCGHKLAIVTNCNREVSNKILEVTNLLRYFEFIIIGNECSNPKPLPDPYAKAISLFNTDNLKAIIFEDSKTGLLSAHSVSPRCIVGIETNYSSEELLKYFANITFKNFLNCNIEYLINNHNYYHLNIIKKYIHNSLNNNNINNNNINNNNINNNNINNIVINDTKLKGGFISDVIDVSIHTDKGVLKCVGKMENKNENFLTKMSNDLDLYNREYYFYNNISNIIPIKIPTFYGIIYNDDNSPIGVLLENINNDEHKLNLNLNNEDISVSLNVIESIAKMHSMFWDKQIPEFEGVKKHNNSLFNWGNFIKSKWREFNKKWNHILTEEQLTIANYICNNFLTIQEKLSDKNLTFCHGDVKSANIFYKMKGETYEPVFIDWQYIALGKGVQDLVFFMIESFDSNKIKIYKNLFKEYYYVKLIENGISYSKEDYEVDFLNATYYFPFFVAIWFGTLNEDELIDKNFPLKFIKNLFHFYTI